MRAVVLEGRGAAAQLVLADLPEPEPGPADLLVAVRAAGCNRADLARRPGHFAGSEAPEGPPVGGLEMAGEVVAVGSEVTGFLPGDRVLAMTSRSWAELVAVDHRLALPVPEMLTWVEAGATAVSFLTAHDALTRAAGLRAGESVLVQGAGSAAGLACVQTARALAAHPVVGTTGSTDKHAALAELGADLVLPTGAEHVPADVLAATAGRGADVVIDILGAGAVQQNVDAAALKGRIVCLGRLAGSAGVFDLDEFARKQLTMVGVTFRTRTAAERFAVAARFRAQALPLLADGALRPVVDRTFPLAEVAVAQDYMRDSHALGKVVLTVG